MLNMCFTILLSLRPFYFIFQPELYLAQKFNFNFSSRPFYFEEIVFVNFITRIQLNFNLSLLCSIQLLTLINWFCCPQVGLMLRAMGFDNTTSVYVASGKIYRAEKYMAPLKQMFPLLETKETLATQAELAPFEVQWFKFSCICHFGHNLTRCSHPSDTREHTHTHTHFVCITFH